MEKLNQYAQIILSLLEEWAETAANDQILTNLQTHHYQLLRTGYDQENRYFFSPRIHIFLRSDAKICILENRTDIEIIDYLLQKGVPQSDILPAFLPQKVRILAGYAA